MDGPTAIESDRRCRPTTAGRAFVLRIEPHEIRFAVCLCLAPLGHQSLNGVQPRYV